MTERYETRLAELRAEFESGNRMLNELHTRESEIRESLLRIAGAITVLDELREAEAEAVAVP
jgi:hypothetical protein